jgi:arginine/lysine/ornithine decarboxylase
MTVLTGLREKAMSVREAYHSKSTKVPLQEAWGGISQAVLCPYPPGIPTVYPGEKIDAAVIEYLTKVCQAGIPVLGVEDRLGIPYIAIVS